MRSPIWGNIYTAEISKYCQSGPPPTFFFFLLENQFTSTPHANMLLLIFILINKLSEIQIVGTSSSCILHPLTYLYNSLSTSLFPGSKWCSRITMSFSYFSPKSFFIPRKSVSFSLGFMFRNQDGWWGFVNILICHWFFNREYTEIHISVHFYIYIKNSGFILIPPQL